MHRERERERETESGENSSTNLPVVLCAPAVNRRSVVFFSPPSLTLSYAHPHSNEAIPRFNPTSESANLFFIRQFTFLFH